MIIPEGRFSNFYGALLLALFLIAFKGSSGEGQPSLFSNLIKKYVEESSASAISYTSHNQVADLTSLAVMQDSGHAEGQGGPETQIELSTTQDSSLFSNSPASFEYLEDGFTENHVEEYEVQSGDVLSGIASDYGVSVQSIIWANNLTNINSLSLGQTLRIPPVTGVIHKIKKGDTLDSIAKKYGVEKEKISQFNRLSDSDPLAVDDELVVPDGIIKASVIAKAVPASVARFSHLQDLGGYFMIPASGYNPRDPKGTRGGGIHGRNGVDVTNSCGTPIFASADGSATLVDGAGYNGGYGYYIKLAHSNGTETLYGHLMKLLIKQGDFVSRGQQIALMGGKPGLAGAGRSTGCHLHFEVHGAKNPLAK